MCILLGLLPTNSSIHPFSFEFILIQIVLMYEPICWALTTVDFIRMVLAVWSTITEHRNRNTLLTECTRKLSRSTALHRHFKTTGGRCGYTGCHWKSYAWHDRIRQVTAKQNNKALCKRHILHLLCSPESPLSGRRSVWTPSERCEDIVLWPSGPASGSRESSQTSSPQKSITGYIDLFILCSVCYFWL